jgi:hypothetical protein
MVPLARGVLDSWRGIIEPETIKTRVTNPALDATQLPHFRHVCAWATPSDNLGGLTAYGLFILQCSN